MRRQLKRISGGVKDYQKVKSSFFDRFYVMPPLTNGGHYTVQPAFEWEPVAGSDFLEKLQQHKKDFIKNLGITLTLGVRKIRLTRCVFNRRMFLLLPKFSVRLKSLGGFRITQVDRKV